MNNNKKLKLFPFLKDVKKVNKLKIDPESLNYISIRETADLITKITEQHISTINKLNNKKIIITDATAGVGGNTLSFSKKFSYVNAIEIEPLRCNYLRNNIDVYNIENVNIYNEDCNKILHTIKKQHVVFIDPPWGGKSYKKHNRLKLKISDIPVEMVCNNLLDNAKTYCPPYLIILKLPKNYDLEYLKKYISSNKIYIHDLKKMLLVIIYNNNTYCLQ